jgi:hypothetical protein
LLFGVAISIIKEDAQEMECEGCRRTQPTIGFAGNKRKGGAPTKFNIGNIYGVSLLVITDFAALGLELDDTWRARPTSFVWSPRGPFSSAFALGGKLFLAMREG